MEYSEIKTALQQKQSELSQINSSLTNVRRQIAKCKETLEGLTSDKEKKTEIEKEKQFKQFCDKIKKPFQDKIDELESKKVPLRESRTKLLDKVNSETYRKKLEKSGIDIEKERESCENLKSMISGFYGEEFSSSIEDVLVIKKYDESKVTTVLNEIKSLSPILNFKLDVNKFVDKLIDGLDGDGENGEFNNTQILLAGIGGLGVIGLAIYASPVVLATILGSTFLCGVKSFKFAKYNSEAKSLLDDVDKLAELKKKAIDKAIKDKIDEIEGKFSNSMNKIDSTIKSVEESMNKELESQKENFVPNYSSIEEEYNLCKHKEESEIDRLTKELSSMLEESETLEKDVQTLQNQLDDELSSLVYKYLPKEVVNNTVLPNDYLIDINGNVPVFFEDKRKSTLFIYDSREHLYEFIKILFLQTTLRVVDNLAIFQLYDCEYFGECLQQFSSSNLVRIFTSKKDIESSLDANEVEVKRRVGLKANYSSIYEYNDFMKSIDCPQESYYYILDLDFDLKSLTSPSVNSMLNLGASCGYFPYLFMSLKSIEELEEKDMKVIMDKIELIYEVNSSVNKITKLKLRKMLLQGK